MILTRNARPVRKSGLLIWHKDDEVLLRFPFSPEIYQLNESAIFIWQLCDSTQNFQEICQSVAQLRGVAAESIEREVSDVIISLIHQELVALDLPKPQPILRLAFIACPDNFDVSDNFFLNLLVNWVDLIQVEPEESPEILISWDRQYADPNAVLNCLVDDDCRASGGDSFDLVFRNRECDTSAEELVVNLPDDYSDNPLPPLDDRDRQTLDQLFGHDTEEPQQQERSEQKHTWTRKLTIGMATYDDFDGVYFSVMAIRMYHPEVTAETEILVIDNNPGGVYSKSLRGLEKSIEGYRYVANDQLQGTAVRDFVFHEARTDYVMCIDSHVFIEQGAIARLISYFDAHRDCRDLLQGPLVHDNLDSIVTHCEPVWRGGMFGIWACDERGKDVESPPFEIPMQGLGLAACRKDAWLGYNRRFSGFGGEEGYIHQKFRNAGARSLCLPFLRWLHRFERPTGTRYKNVWEDRIRNYLIGMEEVSLDPKPVIKHFSKLIGEEAVQKVVRQLELETDNPFDFFDAIYCINLDSQAQRWQEVQRRFQKLGIAHRVRRFSAVETPESHHIGCTLSHRKLVEEAKARGYESILVFEDDVIFHKDALLHLQNSLQELENQRWNVFYLGGMKWMKLGKEPFKRIQGCQYLERPEKMTCTHAVAYNAQFYSTLLNDIPGTREEVDQWIDDKYPAIDQYLVYVNDLVVMTPVIASQPSIFNEEDESMQEGFF